MGTTPFPVNLKKGNKKSSLNQNSDCFLKTYEIRIIIFGFCRLIYEMCYNKYEPCRIAGGIL